MPTATPKFDPMNPAAYEAPELPQVAPPPEPAQKQDSPQYAQPTTYPGKAGSFALIATDIMKGFMDGRAKAQVAQATKLQRQSQAIQSSYKLAATNFADLATSMNITPQQMQQFRAGQRPAGLSDDDFKRLSEANQAVQGSWQAWTSWQGQHIDPGKGSKGKGKKGDQQPQGNILSRISAALKGNDPAAVSREVYQFWVQNGPPVYHQLDAQLANSEQRTRAQKAEGLSTDAAGLKAQSEIDTMKRDSRIAELLGKGSRTPDEDAELHRLEQTRDELASGTGKMTQFDKGFTRYLEGKGKTFSEATAEDEADYRKMIHPHTESQYEGQRAAFAKSLGVTPAEMTWPQEQEFLKQRYSANQPLAERKLALAAERNGIAQQTLALRRSESNFRDFMSIQKNLAPLEKIDTASQRADDYATNPTGPGDVALTFAFIDATKPSSGFRFTETERKWITGSRGIIDGAQARYNQGFEGTVYSPEQRAHMAAIIKQAASQADEQRENMLGAAGGINPTAAAAADQATAPKGHVRRRTQTPQTGAQHKIKIGDKFYTYNGTGDTADLKNYTEVKP